MSVGKQSQAGGGRNGCLHTLPAFKLGPEEGFAVLSLTHGSEVMTVKTVPSLKRLRDCPGLLPGQKDGESQGGG